MPRRAADLPDLSPAAITRLRRRRADGTPLAKIAKELGVSATMLKKHLKAVPTVSGAIFAASPVPAKPHRSFSVPMKRRVVPGGPVEPERSKPALRAMLAEAVRNTPHH